MSRLMACPVLVLVLSAAAALGGDTPPEDIKQAFHLAGIPGISRQARVDVSFGADGLVFQRKKVSYEIPYARIREVSYLEANRVYEKTTYVTALATYGVGTLLILKKHRVDAVILEYVNERGGQMGVVLQVEKGMGFYLTHILAEKGVKRAVPAEAGGKGQEKP